MSAAELLAEEDTVASVCMASMEALLGPQWRSWEPETLWLELDHKKVDVTLGNTGYEIQVLQSCGHACSPFDVLFIAE